VDLSKKAGKCRVDSETTVKIVFTESENLPKVNHEMAMSVMSIVKHICWLTVCYHVWLFHLVSGADNTKVI